MADKSKTTPNAAGYEATADRMVERIRSLIPKNPEILMMVDAWDLLKVPGMSCSDLGVSIFQASWALEKAKELYRLSMPDPQVTTDLIKELMSALDQMLDGWQLRTDGSKWEQRQTPSAEAGFRAWRAISNANAYLEKVGANDRC